MASLDGYPSNITIESMIENGRWAGKEAGHWRRVGAVCLDGVPLLNHPFYLRTPSPNEHRPSKRWSEVMMTARVFAFFEHTANLTLCDPPLPDLHADTQHESEIAIEATEITDSMFQSTIADQLDIALRDAVDERGTTLRYAYWISFDPDQTPRSNDIPQIVDELMRAIEGGAEFRHYKAETSTYPKLAAFGFRISTNDGSRISIGGGDGGGYAPSSLLPTAQGKLDEKRAKARKHYNVSIPLWLVMNITDRHGIWYETMTLFAESEPAIDPFEQVHILYHDALITLFDFGGHQTMWLKSDRRRI